MDYKKGELNALFKYITLNKWTSHWSIILIWLLLGLLVSLPFISFDDWTSYNHLYDPAITFITLFVALGVFIQGQILELKRNRPKVLTVHFKLDNKVVMSHYYADLGDPADIRSMGQQIGQQMGIDSPLLDLDMLMDIEGPFLRQLYGMRDLNAEAHKSLEIKPSGKIVNLYTATIYLTSDQNKRNGATKPAFDKDKYKRQYVLQCVKDSNDKIIYLDDITLQEQPQEPTLAELLSDYSN